MTSNSMTSSDAAWSRERVALLTKLWAKGLSASLIAGRLGGVSRNAVLGKIHRLGLPGRLTASRARSGPSRPRPPERRAPVPAEEPPLRPAAREIPASSPAAKARAKAALRLAFAAAPRSAPAGEESAAGVTLAGLRDHMCRWPEGEPGAPGFHFCGRPKLDGLSYCARHARIAYKSPERRAQSK